MRGSVGVGMLGLALAAIGGALIWRGHTGHCEMYHMLGHSSAGESQSSKGQSPSGSQQRQSAGSRHDESHAAGDVV